MRPNRFAGRVAGRHTCVQRTGAAVSARVSSSLCRTVSAATFRPSTSARAVSLAPQPMVSIGCRTVLSGGARLKASVSSALSNALRS